MSENPKNNSLKNLIYFIVFLFIVLLPFILLELSLNLAGYGVDTRVFLKARFLQGFYYDNLYLGDKYFSKPEQTNKTRPNEGMIRNIFQEPKPAGTLRGFLIGESSAQGFPYHSNQSFGKITEMALKKAGKYKNIEIINLGESAMSSFYICDVAEKIRIFEPDFILIYAGHNEYYGNVSETTGGNYLTKSLYVKLKEFKIFQLVFNILNPVKKMGGGEGITLMERQFNEKQVPENNITDKRVADIFLSNLDKIIRLYKKANIPVIVAEPVCNLIDMPPFSGDKDAEFMEYIIKYINVLNSKNKKEIASFYDERKKHPEYDKNANIRYLDAHCEGFLNGISGFDSYVAAKDLDTIPFRVRSALQKELLEYYRSHTAAYPNLYYIPLTEILRKDYGDPVFGNTIFIDQLHFNQHGQRILSKIIAGKIADVFAFNELEKKKVLDYYNNEAGIDSDIHYLPAYKIESELKINSIVSRAPFISMLIKYNFDLTRDFKSINEMDKGLIDLFYNSHLTFVDPVVVGNYYLQKDDTNNASKYFDAGTFVYPGTYYMYMARAKYEESIIRNPDEARESYRMAYLLSEKNRIIYEDMTNYFISLNRKDWADEIDRLYGKP